MASIYRKKADKGNRRAAWYFSFVDETGKRRQRKGFTDKAATEKLALKLEEEAKMVREGIRAAKPDQSQLAIRPLLESYLKHLRQRDVSEKQIENLRPRLVKSIEACQFVLVTDIEGQPVEDFLAKRREAGLSKQTSNHYRQAMHQFCRWLCKRSLIKANPIAEIPKLNVDTDRRHDRRAISVDEFQRLVIAAESSKSVQAIAGIDRAIIYILSASTGYRRGEISSLTLASFEFEATPPRVTVDASYSKRRKKDVQVLSPEVAAKIREWLEVRVPTHDRLLFPLTKETCGFDRRTSIMMKHDLGVARASWIGEAGGDDEERTRRAESDYLSYKNAAGLFADFHANRHTFITNLSRAGVLPKVAQTLARHSDIRLTMNIYTHTDLDEKVDAIGKLPSFRAAEATPTADPVGQPKKPEEMKERGESCQRHSST
jgi:site-specific recombinase XerC